MITFFRGELTRLLCAEAGVDGTVQQFSDLVDPAYDPKPPWQNVGVARENPLLTIRAGLRVIIFDGVAGEWPMLENLGVGMQFSLATMQGHGSINPRIITNVGPAAVEYMSISTHDAGFQGRIDFSLLGPMRTFEG